MNSAGEILEDNLVSFVAGLDLDFAKLHEIAPRFLALFTEAVLSMLVLEYAIRKKGLLDDQELSDALLDAQTALERIRTKRGVIAAGRA